MNWKFNYRLLSRITAAILLGIVLIRFFLINIVDTALRNQLEKIRQPDLSIDYNGLSIGWYSPSVYIDHMEVVGMGQSDTAMKISVERIHFQDIRLRKLFFHKEIIVGRISLDQTVLSTKTGQRMEWKNFPKQGNLNSGLKLFSKEFRFKNFQWNHFDERDELAMIAGTQRFSIFGIQYRSKALPGDGVLFDSIGCRDFSFVSPAIQHKITIGSVDYSRNLKELNIGEVRVVPLLDKFEFAQYFKRQVDRIECNSRKIKLTDVTYKDKGSIYLKAGKMAFDFHMETYRNKTYPFNRKKASPMPRELLKKTGFIFDIDTFELHDGFIAYEELDSLYNNPGRIYFKGLNIRANHFSNDSKYNGNTLRATSQFMESGVIEAEFFFPEDSAKKYRVQGSLSPMDLSEINGILKAASLFEVKTGTLDTMRFLFDYDRVEASGKVEFAFNDLKLVAYKKKSPEKISIMKTLVINQVIRMNKVKNANLIGHIGFKRDPVRSVVSYWWRSLFSGIKSAFVKDGSFNPTRNESGTLGPKFKDE